LRAPGAVHVGSAGARGGSAGAAAPTARTNLAQLAERVQARHDRPLLLVFWATWCEPCVAEIPDLVTFHTQRAAEIDIMAVSLDAFLHGVEASQQKVDAFLGETHVPYENVLFTGSQDELFTHFSMPGGIPYAILFGADGNVLERFAGRVDVARLQRALAAPATGS
jgi:thiol-disulfide isomerase/thioredoxin